MVLTVDGSGCRVQGAGFRVQGSECRVQGLGSRVATWLAPSRTPVLGLGFGVWGLRVWGLGFRV